LTRITWARNIGTVLIWTSNSCDLEDGVHDTADTLSCDETSRNCVAVDVEVGGLLLDPVANRDSTRSHRSSVLCLRKREGKTDDHHVGVVDAVFLPFASVGVVSDEDHDAAEDAEND
jgi:hypothetical protein